MKLLVCLDCSDVISLSQSGDKTCSCGKSGGMYVNDLDAVYRGNSLLLGFDNSSFIRAIKNEMNDRTYRTPRERGHEFTAFVIPWNASSVKKQD